MFLFLFLCVFCVIRRVMRTLVNFASEGGEGTLGISDGWTDFFVGEIGRA